MASISALISTLVPRTRPGLAVGVLDHLSAGAKPARGAVAGASDAVLEIAALALGARAARGRFEPLALLGMGELLAQFGAGIGASVGAKDALPARRDLDQILIDLPGPGAGLGDALGIDEHVAQLAHRFFHLMRVW